MFLRWLQRLLERIDDAMMVEGDDDWHLSSDAMRQADEDPDQIHTLAAGCCTVGDLLTTEPTAPQRFLSGGA